MALQKQRVPISINAGIDTKTDAANVAATSFLEAENITYQKLGAATKRFGYTDLTTSTLSGGNITSGTSLAKYSNELVLTDATSLYAYSANKDKWVTQDAFRHFTSETKTITNDGNNIFVAAHATAGNTVGYVYSSATSITNTYTLSIKDVDTDTIIYTRALTTQGNIAANANGYLIVDGNSITFFNTTTLVESAPSTAVRYSYDALKSDGTNFYMLRVAGSSAQLTKLDQTLTVLSSADVSIGYNPDRSCLSFEQNGTYLRVSLGRTTGGSNVISFTRTTADLTVVGHAPVTIVAATNIQAITAIQLLTDANKSLVLIQNTTNTILKLNIDSTGAITTSGTLYAESLLGSEIALLNSKHYVVLCNKLAYTSPATEQTVNCVSYVCETSDDATWAPVAYFNKDMSIPYSIYSGATPSNPSIYLKTLIPMSTGLSVIGIAYDGFVDVTANDFKPTALTECRFHLSASSEISRVYSQNALIYNGAMPLLFDGTQVSEQGFISRPQITNITTFAGIGAFPAGQYQFVAVYAYRDSNGNTYRSAPSDIQTLTVAGTVESIKVYYSLPQYSLKNNIEIEVYRTVAGGSLFYKVPNNSYYPSGPGYVNVSYQTPTALVAGEQLYTDGGALGNDSMQPSYFNILHKNRMISVNIDRTSISYSQIIQQGTPIAFSDAFDINLNSVGGKITSLATLDNYIIIFKENAIYAITGDGPNNLGQQDDYGEPQFITGDTGCQDRNTVVTMPQGVMLNTPKGIYLLSRSLTCSYIGAPVEAYNGTMLCSILMPAVNEVRFATAAGTTLVYDYLTARWSTFPSQSAIAMALDVNNVYNYLTTDGLVHRQNTGYTDNGTFIPMKITSAWISLSGLQGYERFYKLHILGTFKNSHYLKVSLAYNFIDSFTESVTIDTSTLPSTDLYELVIRPQIQKCTSFKFKIEDLQNGTAGESLSISNFAMELGMKSGSNKRAAGFNFGASGS